LEIYMPAVVIKVLVVSAGGAIGSALRYGLSGLAYRLLGTSFPWGTLVVNVLGCFLIGLLWGLTERFPIRPATTLFLFGGALGAFTTFSTYGLESINLLRDGEVVRCAVNVLASNVVGISVVYVGFVVASLVFSTFGSGGQP
jgi:CrcB protein